MLTVQSREFGSAMRLALHRTDDVVHSLPLLASLPSRQYIQRRPRGLPARRGMSDCLFPTDPAQLNLYLSSLLSLFTATLLGFLDDLFDIRWRHKLPIPLIAAIPMLLVYYSEGGLTSVILPASIGKVLTSLGLPGWAGNMVVNLGESFRSAVLTMQVSCTTSTS